MSVPDLINQLAGVWRRRMRGAARGAIVALGFAVLVVGAHLGRLGTPLSRALVAGAWLLVIAIGIGTWLRDRRDWLSVRRTISRVLLPTDQALGERALRALALTQRAEQDPSVGSLELARLHFARLLERAPLAAVERRAMARARAWKALAWVFLAVASVAVVLGPMRVAEGLDVLVARNGRAPVPLPWLDAVRVSAEPPAYLRQSTRRLLWGFDSAQPVGTLLTVRGEPLRDGRKLVLTDGRREVPFVSDASGGVVARWTLSEPAELFVAARFGEVVIYEPEGLSLDAEADRAPVVELETAPRTVKLSEIERLELRYVASDDNGLRQVDLVLRAGGREDRRVLSRLGGDSNYEQGGYVLEPRDPFLKRMFLPVLVTIEARDNDPLAGPKWGSSEAITLVPPAVGAPEAERFRALAGARSAIVDVLAWQMSEPDATGAEARRERRREDRERTRRAAQALREAADGSYAGLPVPDGLRSYLVGQARLLETPPRPGLGSQRRTEDVLLAVDVATRALGNRDAAQVAKRLADVAEEAADAARHARESERSKLAEKRLVAAIAALGEGADQLLVLDRLGADLGSVAQADLGRIRRAHQKQDLMHTELAARHLAGRLRRPNPSFGSARRGGVESGMGGSSTPSGSPSDADRRFNQMASELEQLAQEHSGQIGDVEQSLAEAEQGVSLDELSDEAKERANEVRRAVAGMPRAGAEPGSARAAAALGREHAAAMAESLERLNLAEAVESGRDALSALEDAERKARERRGLSDWIDSDELKQAKETLEEQLRWAEAKLDELKRQAEERARRALGEAGEREQDFARRADNLEGRGKHGEAALPQDVLENLERAASIMREAAKRLEQGKGEEGLKLQREAQRMLERANTGKTDDPDRGPRPRPNDDHDANGRDVMTGGDVPDEKKSERAEDFRKRVLEGLGKGEGTRLAPAIKRYAEGLLR